MNRTVTVQGHEFYRYFSMWWHHNPEASNYSIAIHERPSARWGSEIWVDYHNTQIFHMFLPPARARTKEISREAAAYSLQRIEENELEKALYQNIDLGPEEMVMKTKLLISTLGLSFVLATPLMAATTGTIQQNGSYNQGFINQRGQNLNGTITQTGTSNVAYLSQN